MRAVARVLYVDGEHTVFAQTSLTRAQASDSSGSLATPRARSSAKTCVMSNQ